MPKLKGLWIPAEILLNKDLSDKEKIILSMILYLSEETKSCFASNKYIASIVNVTANRVSKIISSLKDKEYIKVKLKLKYKIIASIIFSLSDNSLFNKISAGIHSPFNFGIAYPPFIFICTIFDSVAFKIAFSIIFSSKK